MNKIIDEKGRLFGKINIVDLAVIVIIIAVIAVVVIRLNSQRMNARSENPLSDQETVYVTLTSSLVVPEIAESIKPGDKLVANNHFTTGEVVSVESVPASYVSNNSEGKAVLSEHPLWKDLTIVIKDKVDPSSVILKAGEQEVRVGYSYIFKTQTVETNCKIRGIDFVDEAEIEDTTEDTYNLGDAAVIEPESEGSTLQ